MNKTENEGLSSLQSTVQSDLINEQTNVIYESFKPQSREYGTMTDKDDHNCDCEMVVKLKEKAYRAFMQVIQVQNMYKQQIEQLKESFEVRLRHQQEKYNFLNEQCKFLEDQLEKAKKLGQREYYERKKSGENPFFISDIDSILVGPSADESEESIITHIKDFITHAPYKDVSLQLQKNIIQFLKNAKQIYEPEILQKNRNLCKKTILDDIQRQIDQYFTFVSKMMQKIENDCEKIEQLMKQSVQAEQKVQKNKKYCNNLQKDIKFMTEHIRKISHQNLMLKKRNKQLEKSSKSFQKKERKQGNLKILTQNNKQIRHSYQQRQGNEEILKQSTPIGCSLAEKNVKIFQKFNIFQRTLKNKNIN